MKAIKFMTCSMLAPPKKDVLKYLGIPTYPGEKVPKREDAGLMPKRRAETDVGDIMQSLQKRRTDACPVVHRSCHWVAILHTPQIFAEMIIEMRITLAPC